MFKFKEKQTVTAGNNPFSIIEESETMTAEEREKILSYLAKNPPKALSPFFVPKRNGMTAEEWKIEKDKRYHETITAENIFSKSVSTAISGLKTIYKNSGDSMVWKLLVSCYDYAVKAEIIQNGAISIPVPTVTGYGGEDIISLVSLILSEYIEKSLATETDKIKTKGKNKGQKKTVLSVCYTEINKAVYGQKKELKTACYLSEYENENGEYIEKDFRVSSAVDFSSKNEFDSVSEMIDSLHLSPTEKGRVWQRMNGKTMPEIAKKEGVSKQAVSDSLNKAKKRLSEKYGFSEEYLKKRAERLENKTESEKEMILTAFENRF